VLIEDVDDGAIANGAQDKNEEKHNWHNVGLRPCSIGHIASVGCVIRYTNVGRLEDAGRVGRHLVKDVTEGRLDEIGGTRRCRCCVVQCHCTEGGKDGECETATGNSKFNARKPTCRESAES